MLRSSQVNLKILIWALLAIAIITVVFARKGALQDVHWDAPIYLLHGKEFAETPYLRDYVMHASEIAESLPRFKLNEDQGTPYWGFMRLGNTILIGALTAAAGASLGAVDLVFWTYTFLLAAAVVLAILCSLRLVDLLGSDVSKRSAVKGAIISGALYMASDVYRYLSGNLVAEIPALFLLTGSVLALVEAIRLRAVSLAILSGGLGFALYVVKIDAVFNYVSFILAFWAILAYHDGKKMWWPGCFIAAFSAVVLYAVYAWWFWPLPDPRLFLVFEQLHEAFGLNPVLPIKLYFVAGGALWIGFLLALRYRMRDRAMWLAVAWLILVSLPHSETIFHGRQSQTRWFALIMPPLLLGSTLGWASLADRVTENRVHKATVPFIAACALVLIALSQAESYAWLRQLPGGWRLQHVKEWLSPPRYERLFYPVAELKEISHFVYNGHGPTVVVVDQGKYEEYFHIIAYLGSRLGPSSEQLATHDASVPICGVRKLRPEIDAVTFCITRPSAETIAQLRGKVRVFYLRHVGDPIAPEESQREAVVFATRSLILSTSIAP